MSEDKECREAFEAAMLPIGLVDMWLETDDAGNYTFTRTMDAWLGWQACWNRRAAKPAAPEGCIAVPVDAYLWLMGLGQDGFEKARPGAFWWRSAFNERAALDMMAIYEASQAVPTPPAAPKEST